MHVVVEILYLTCVAVPPDVLQHADKDAKAQHDEYPAQGEGGALSTQVAGDDKPYSDEHDGFRV
jgi:hypothetical protein